MINSLFSILNVARDGMAAQSAGLDVTGQNVSNVSTPGYVRRGVALEDARGGGVLIQSQYRTTDRFAEARVISEAGKHAAASARSAALAGAESILAPSPGPGIGDRASAFFAALTAFSATPEDPSARAAALAAAGSLAGSISGAADQLAAQRGDLLSRAKDTAAEVNERLTKIAALNDQIALGQAAGDAAPDLVDQRDQLVREVSERVDVQSLPRPDGGVTLLSGGAALVDGKRAAALDVGLDPQGAMRIAVRRPGGAPTDVTPMIHGGALGGLREARDVDLSKAAGALDQFAFDLAGAVNALHTTGYGADGQTGRALFQTTATAAGAAHALKLDPAVAGDPAALAGTANPGSLPGGNDLALQLAALASQPLGGASTPAVALSSIAANLGLAKQASDAEVSLREGTLGQATALRDTASGVSIDEEMVNLTRYQRAYEASLRVLSTTNDLLEGLLQRL